MSHDANGYKLTETDELRRETRFYCDQHNRLIRIRLRDALIK